MRRLAGNDPEVNEEWITDKDRFAFHYATQADRLTYPQVRDRIEDGGDGSLRPASWPEAFAVAARGLRAAGAVRRADRWPGHRRGRLRLQQVRPRRARHQRHRLPRPPALGRGGVLPRGRGGAHATPVTYADLETATTVVLAGPRARGRGRDDLPAAAQGLSATGTRVVAIAPYTSRGLAQDGRPAGAAPLPAPRPRRSTALVEHAEFGIDSTRRDPGRRAPGHRARRAERRRGPGPQDRRPARLGAASRR